MSKQTMTIIDPAKLRAFVEKKGVENVTKMLGKSSGYFHNVYARKTMPESVLNAMCTIFDVSPADIKPDPPKPKPPVLVGILDKPLPFKSEQRAARPMPSVGYAIDLQVKPDFVVMTLVEDSKVIKHAKARIKKENETATQFEIVQAISYAAHLIYKFVEQDEIGA